MRILLEFLVGLVFLMAVGVMGILGILLLPFLMVLGFFLRMIVSILLLAAAIWLLGKVMMSVWKYLSKKEQVS